MRSDSEWFKKLEGTRDVLLKFQSYSRGAKCVQFTLVIVELLLWILCFILALLCDTDQDINGIDWAAGCWSILYSILMSISCKSGLFINRSSRRKRGMASNPLFIIPDFFFAFSQ